MGYNQLLLFLFLWLHLFFILFFRKRVLNLIEIRSDCFFGWVTGLSLVWDISNYMGFCTPGSQTSISCIKVPWIRWSGRWCMLYLLHWLLILVIWLIILAICFSDLSSILSYIFTGWWCCQYVELTEMQCSCTRYFIECVWRWDPSYADAHCWGDYSIFLWSFWNEVQIIIMAGGWVPLWLVLYQLKTFCIHDDNASNLRACIWDIKGHNIFFCWLFPVPILCWLVLLESYFWMHYIVWH